MGFEVPPERVRRGSAARGLAVAVACVLIVAVAIATSLADRPAPSPSGDPGAAPIAGGPSSAELRSAADPASAWPSPYADYEPATPRPLPPEAATTCHDVDRAACIEIVAAAVRRLPADAPDVVSVQAWASLVCDDSRDCPPSRLAGRRPLGSAVVSFGTARAPAWMNVVVPDPAPGCDCAAVAWIVRWDA